MTADTAKGKKIGFQKAAGNSGEVAVTQDKQVPCVQ